MSVVEGLADVEHRLAYVTGARHATHPRHPRTHATQPGAPTPRSLLAPMPGGEEGWGCHPACPLVASEISAARRVRSETHSETSSTKLKHHALLVFPTHTGERLQLGALVGCFTAARAAIVAAAK